MRAYPSTALRRMTRTYGSIEYNELNRCRSLAIMGTFLLVLEGIEHIDVLLFVEGKLFIDGVEEGKSQQFT